MLQALTIVLRELLARASAGAPAAPLARRALAHGDGTGVSVDGDRIGGGRVITTPFQFVADADTFLRVDVGLFGDGRHARGARAAARRQRHAPADHRDARAEQRPHDAHAGLRLGAGAMLNLTMFRDGRRARSVGSVT
jgi:hypothetical protein